MIDLSSNENPYPPSPNVTEALSKDPGNLNRYTGVNEIRTLKQSLAEYCGSDPERVIPGPGTDYLLEKAICRMSKGRDVVVMNPTTLRCIGSARYVGSRVVRKQLIPPEFRIDWTAAASGTGLFLMEHPNNPTGQMLISREELKKLLKNDDNLVIVDEAGYEYSHQTFADLVPTCPNLAVTRTLDKAFGLAGLHISWMIGGDYFLKELKTADGPISRLACRGALAAVEDRTYALDCAARTVLERDRLAGELLQLGMEVFPSEANFLLVRTEQTDFALRLKEAGILISDLSHTWLPNFYRITVGTSAENTTLVEAIGAF